MMALKVKTMIIRAEIALFCNLGSGPRDKKNRHNLRFRLSQKGILASLRRY